MTAPIFNRYIYEVRRAAGGRQQIWRLLVDPDTPRRDWHSEPLSTPLRISAAAAQEIALLIGGAYWDGRCQGRKDDRD